MLKRKYRKDKYRNVKQKKEKYLTPEEALIEEEHRVKSKLVTGLIVFFSLVLIVALLFAGAWFLCEIENVKVEGNELYEDSLIAEQILNDEYSWNALYVFFKYKFTETGTMPFIDKMKVSIEDRNTIVIHVYEKELVGYTYITSTGQYAYIDKDGIVVERSTNIIEGVAYIEGFNVTEVSLYEKLQVENDTVFKDLLDITQELQKSEFMPEKITLKDREYFELSYGDIVVNFGQAEHIHGKVEHMTHIMKLLDGKSGILHMENWKNETSSSPFEELETTEKNE